MAEPQFVAPSYASNDELTIGYILSCDLPLEVTDKRKIANSRIRIPEQM